MSNFQRKFNKNFKRKNPTMRKLIFAPETYNLTPVQDKDGKNTDKSFLKHKTELVGLLELLWTGVINSPCTELSKKEHKVNKRLQASLETVTRYKDSDEDARVALEGRQELIIEEDEYELLKKLMEANKFFGKISSQVSDLWDVIDTAETFTPLKAVPANESKSE